MDPLRQITLETEDLQVAVRPGYGARVVSLVDRRSGREWLAQGGLSAQTGEDAAYRQDEAVGWDECFPTVAPCDATDTPWRRRLRDHGDLWGRPWTVESRTPTSLHASFSGVGYHFHRTLSLDGPVLTAAYRLDSTAGEPLPFMWSLHALLAPAPDDAIDLPGVDRVEATYLGVGGSRLVRSDLAWPGPNDAPAFPLDRVQPVSAGFAGKLYARDLHRASTGGPQGWLDITWEGVDHVGIWLAYGGWPAPGSPVHQVALEPTTDAADHLAHALARASAAWLLPGGSAVWRVTMTVRGGARPAFGRP